jgi:hypothetical protein
MSTLQGVCIYEIAYKSHRFVTVSVKVIPPPNRLKRRVLSLKQTNTSGVQKELS